MKNTTFTKIWKRFAKTWPIQYEIIDGGAGFLREGPGDHKPMAVTPKRKIATLTQLPGFI
jgi:hypothetical protein